MNLAHVTRKFLVSAAVPVTLVIAFAAPFQFSAPLASAATSDLSIRRDGSAHYSDSTLSLRASSDSPEPTTHGAQQQWAVHGVLASALVYQLLTLTVDGGEQFQGYAGGVSFPGGAAVWGTLFTDDIQRLYDQTASFQFNAVGPYLNVNFFDRHGTLLGHAQLGGVSSVIGIGGGSGTWTGDVA